MGLVTIKRACLAIALAATLLTAACTATAPHGSAGPSPSLATSAPSPAKTRPFPTAENKRPGTSTWRITDLGAPGAIEGYADQQSILPGQSFRLYVSTTAKSFQVKAFRFGWYAGHQARLVWASRQTRGQRQTAVHTTPGTHMVTAPWRPSLTINAEDWPPGSYLLRLDASSGAERYVPITVRSASTAGAVAWVVYDLSSWIFQGTGANKGERFDGMVGPEYDRLDPAVPFPRPMQVLAHSPLTCDGFSTFSDSVYYTVASGAGVFASGTMRWVCAIRGPHCGHGLTRAAERFVDRATQNLLRAFAAGPAGQSHPAHDNVAQVKPARIAALYDGVD